jgi:hypothetical protein
MKEEGSWPVDWIPPAQEVCLESVGWIKARFIRCVAFDIHVVAPTGPHFNVGLTICGATGLESLATRPAFGQKGSCWDGSKAFGRTAVRGAPLLEQPRLSAVVSAVAHPKSSRRILRAAINKTSIITMNSLLLHTNAPSKEELDQAIGSLMKEVSPGHH